MEQTKIVLCDTDIIIEFYKDNPDIVKKLKNVGQNNIAVSIITAGELIYGTLNKKELDKIKKDLEHIAILGIDKSVCDTFLKIMFDYSLSHKLSLPDGFIAAIALTNDIELFTLNKKHYKFIKGLKLYD